MNLPYIAEYARSNLSSCYGCYNPIKKGVLRLGIMVQAPHFDRIIPNWYHLPCFFKKCRIKNIDDIGKFEILRWEDQEILKKIIDKSNISSIIQLNKSNKRGADSLDDENVVKDFVIEYSKSEQAICHRCDQKFLMGEIKISKKNLEIDMSQKYEIPCISYHLTCFAKLRFEFGCYESADKLPGFQELRKDDQKEVIKQIPAIKKGDVPDLKKIKKEDSEKDVIERQIKEQTRLYYSNRDKLNQLKKGEMHEILKSYGQIIPEGIDGVLDHLADHMTFGVPESCKVCNDGQLVYSREGYKCSASRTEWTECLNIVKEPMKGPMNIPKELQRKYPFLKNYKYEPRIRIIKDFNPTVETKEKEDEVHTFPALYEMEFVIIGDPPSGKDILKNQITRLGGKVVSNLKENTMAVIATPKDVEIMNNEMQDAKNLKIHVVSEDFVEEAKNNSGKIPNLIVEKCICPWGSDPSTRLPKSLTKSLHFGSKSYISSMPGKVKLKLVNGVALDPELERMTKEAHVYQEHNTKWSVVLGFVDIATKRNSFYKLILFKSNSNTSFWVYRAWGRIGTENKNSKLECMPTLHDAQEHFKTLFENKTGNNWSEKEYFVKVPRKMYLIDLNYDEVTINENHVIVELDSKLKHPVQELIRLIFDVNTMNNLIWEFDLDLEKMPLGKVSESQILQAYEVLAKLEQLLDETNTDRYQFMCASNQFYTLIPHSFGLENAPLLDNRTIIQKKTDMLDNLREMQIAYNLISTQEEDNTVDKLYEQLNAKIDVLEKTSKEFGMIEEYIKKTHAESHYNYTLEIDEVFNIERKGEKEKFKPFSKLNNHKLLWHGSRLNNFAAIISQGLKIAPPQAPRNGYMFGKGIYFADMVSKSANYCHTNLSNPTGIVLLCDVALGNMYERYEADYIEKLPKGFYSCKGVGKTQPDFKQSKTLDGIEVPLGEAQILSESTALLYNEYIVYDEAQVNIKYLVKLKFNYKY